jgi:hypothetical protein
MRGVIKRGALIGCLASSLAVSTCETASSFADRGTRLSCHRERPKSYQHPTERLTTARARSQPQTVLERPGKRKQQRQAA